MGLGNPGPQFDNTRHNVGFWVLDSFFHRLDWQLEKKFKSFWLKERNSFFIKPTTYMNNSGAAVVLMMQYYRIRVEDLLVVHDEIDFPPGVSKLKKGGSSSHNGIKDIVRCLGTDHFWRLRVGIGRPQRGQVYDHVLGTFLKAEQDQLSKVITKVKRYQEELFYVGDLEKARDSFNFNPL